MKIDARDVSQVSTANVLTAQFADPIEQPIILYDMTLREGEQPPGVVFTRDEKLEIARALDNIGVHWAGVGFPAVSEHEQQTVKELAQAGFRMKTVALCRMSPADIDLTLGTGVQVVALFYPGSDVHLREKLGKT